MPYLLAAVTVLSVVNLALLFTVIRRVREHAERLAKLPQRRKLQRLPVGTKIPEFTAVTVTGESQSLTSMAGARSLVGFFTPGCPECRDQLPGFAKSAKSILGAAGQVLAVVAGPEKQAMAFAAELGRTELGEEVPVVVEPYEGPVAKAFSVLALPSFFLVGADGRIEDSGLAVNMLAVPTPA